MLFHSSQKNVLFAHDTGLPPRVLASQAADQDQTWSACAPLNVVLVAKCEDRILQVVCVSTSCLGLGGLIQFSYQLFAIQNRRSFAIRKNDPGMGQAPTFHAGPRDTDRLRPSNLAARTLSLVEHTLYKFGGDPCLVRQVLVAAVKCYVLKTRFFRCPGRL